MLPEELGPMSASVHNKRQYSKQNLTNKMFANSLTSDMSHVEHLAKLAECLHFQPKFHVSMAF